MNKYRDEWIALLLKQNFKGWLIASDQDNIFINIPDDQDLETAMTEFKKKIIFLRPKVKNKPEKLGFFIGNTLDSKFYELR